VTKNTCFARINPRQYLAISNSWIISWHTNLSLPGHTQPEIPKCVQHTQRTAVKYCMLQTTAFVSPHGIAMPKGLYFTTAVSSSSFFQHLISEDTEQISAKLGLIFLWLLFEKCGPNSPGIYPAWAGGGKNVFVDWLWTLTEHISATERDISNRKETCQATGTSLHASQIWWTLVH